MDDDFSDNCDGYDEKHRFSPKLKLLFEGHHSFSVALIYTPIVDSIDHQGGNDVQNAFLFVIVHVTCCEVVFTACKTLRT